MDKVSKILPERRAVASLRGRHVQQGGIGSVLKGETRVHLQREVSLVLSKKKKKSTGRESGPQLTDEGRVPKEGQGREACTRKHSQRQKGISERGNCIPFHKSFHNCHLYCFEKHVTNSTTEKRHPKPGTGDTQEHDFSVRSP